MLEAVLSGWTVGLLAPQRDLQPIAAALAARFTGTSPRPTESQLVRSTPQPTVHRSKFSESSFDRDAFLRTLESELAIFSTLETAEFQIISIRPRDGQASSSDPPRLETRIRYEIAGRGSSFHKEHWVGHWQLRWEADRAGTLRIAQWSVLEETRSRAESPIFVDVSSTAFARNASYHDQLLHGTDYWRTILDGACGIDIYGHNGVAAVDFDNDGFDDLYVCQPAGLPNRLYHNRGDGTFEDVTEQSGLGILENTACALFADFDNDGRQDVIVVRTNGPLLFLNQGGGKFREIPDAFQFANPPQGTFTGAAVADYDRDGWLDIYFCLYSYYQGTGQYKYPSPYHDAENGPPNFLMHNQRDGTFRDVTSASGLDKNNTRYSFCCAWNDYNRDGWPDLYVVNDFGRKNLYRNNGDGTFTDVASGARCEDVGAGMSVSWLDYENDGAPDLYVANMWTAAGIRVSMQEAFKSDSPAEVRALYQKHAMGNSLLRNSGAAFDDATNSSGAGMGRWAWSSDTFDFDHDGFADLYIVNGMVSGPQRSDLNSFFWRQVVANSPDTSVASPAYEQGWNAINELIRSDASWSGYERNVFYANNRDGTFSDVSASVGLDFLEDGRSFALADFDHDGRIEIALKNRNAPQLRSLKNAMKNLPPSISFRLEGVKSNRDAIGAVVSVETSSIRQSKMLQAGSGFLSQHGKDVFFGLGDANGPVRATIQWPGGLRQELNDLPVNQRIWVREGEPPQRFEPFNITPAELPAFADPAGEEQSLPENIETWLLAPVPAPDFTLPDISGRNHSSSAFRGKPVLLNFWTIKSERCKTELLGFQKCNASWSASGLQFLAVNVDGVQPKDSSARAEVAAFARQQHFSFPVLFASEDVAAVYNITFRQLFDRHRDLPVPASFLIDPDGQIVKAYQGNIVPAHVERDFQNIPHTDAERMRRALPFSSVNSTLAFGRNHLSSGALFFQRGYLDQAEVSFQQALRDDPSSAEALYGIGSVYLNQGKNAAAREMFERCVKLRPNYPGTLPDAWNNLGVLATREGNIPQSIDCFRHALQLSPNHLLSLDNLGNAYRVEKLWNDAREVLERALALVPDDAEANYSLGMVFAQTGDNAKAYDHLQRALTARPAYPEALNNLGVLYVVTERRDLAVAAFEQCIRVAPEFDQAYLNLARIYALEGTRDKAREILLDLLKRKPDHAQARQMLQQLQ